MLTPRELEIVKYLPSGLLNKQIAAELNIAEQTVKIHRRNICDKLSGKIGSRNHQDCRKGRYENDIVKIIAGQISIPLISYNTKVLFTYILAGGNFVSAI